MIWTATERESMVNKKAIDIRDKSKNVLCCVYPTADNPAAIEQMRARARLIVQAEAMRDALVGVVNFGELGNVPIDGGYPPGPRSESKDVWQFPRHLLPSIRAIIKATGGEDG